jgi:hypothetical protein
MGSLSSKASPKVKENETKDSTTSGFKSLRIYKNIADRKLIPPHPGPDWTRFLLMSDMHSRAEFRVPEGDVLIHAGDLSSWVYPVSLIVRRLVT